MQDAADPQAIDRSLDEPLPAELSADEKRRAELRRIADENRAASAVLTQAATLRKA